MARTVVVKLGGSLLDWPGFPEALAGYLKTLSDDRVVLVVGGGAVVDALRVLDSALGIGDKLSHALALRALDVTARLVAALVPGLRVVERREEVLEVWKAERVPVVSPGWWMEHVDRHALDPLPESWETTTDSIAARIARDFPADTLVLLKSTWPGAGGSAFDRTRASRSGFVDPFFPRASARFDRVEVINLRASPTVFGVLI